jgi:hypothetical protein
MVTDLGTTSAQLAQRILKYLKILLFEHLRKIRVFRMSLLCMEMHNIFTCDMDCFIRECVSLFHDRQSRGYLSLFFFAFSFSSNVLVLLFSMF